MNIFDHFIEFIILFLVEFSILFLDVYTDHKLKKVSLRVKSKPDFHSVTLLTPPPPRGVS